jgi:hypothetical protein
LNKDPVLSTKRWLQRKHKIRVTPEEAKQIIEYYQEIYKFISEILPKFTRPTTTGFSSPEFIDRVPLEKEILATYNEEDENVLRIVEDWVVYYEYLR